MSTCCLIFFGSGASVCLFASSVDMTHGVDENKLVLFRAFGGLEVCDFVRLIRCDNFWTDDGAGTNPFRVIRNDAFVEGLRDPLGERLIGVIFLSGSSSSSYMMRRC